MKVSPQCILNSWKKLPVRWRGTLLISVPAFCLVVTTAAWIWTRYHERMVARQVSEAEMIIGASNELLIGLINAETALRGYWITRDRSFLEPYNAGISSLPGILNRLQESAQANPERSARIRTLRKEVEERVEFFKIGLQWTETLPSTYVIQSGDLIFQAKARMDAVRSTLNALQDAERMRLSVYQQWLASIQEWTSLILAVTVLLSLIGSAGSIYLFRYVDRELDEQQLLLGQSKSLLEAITSNVVDSVISLNHKNEVETFNSAAVQLFGYLPEEILGQSLTQLLKDPIVECEPDADEKTRCSWQTSGIRKDGTQIPIEISLSDLQANRRRIAIIRDITKYLQIEASLKTRAEQLTQLSAKLATSNASLQERNQELDQFAYVASHDLKAPLRAISNLSEWLEEDLIDKLSEENKQQMRLLRGRVHRLESLIDGLLEYSRVGRIQQSSDIVPVKELLVEVIDLLDPPNKFKVTIDQNMPILKTQRLSLTQVFTNLISNAIKHHPGPEGNIHISVKEQQNVYEFAVADDGAGIDPAFHQKIFAIFQTLEARDVKEGAGIGLSIVKKIVEMQGGTIRVESQVGKGSTFYFTWPRSLACVVDPKQNVFS